MLTEYCSDLLVHKTNMSAQIFDPKATIEGIGYSNMD